MERIGVIGGSGLYHLEGLEKKDEISLNTPFGAPSDKFVLTQFKGKEIVFLPRHGKKHTINPSCVNYRANIYGMKKLDVTRIISVSACGSLKKELKPLDFVVPDQFIDRTSQARKNTFFDHGLVVHVGFANPVCSDLAAILIRAAQNLKITVHSKGTYVNMEGPQFSTLAESNLYRSWGMDIIGMTNMVEARLAREAEICYASLAAITDYDCWCQSEETVTIDIILDNLRKNVENSKKILVQALGAVDAKQNCACKDALACAIVTNSEAIASETKEKFSLLIGKYIK